MIGYVLTISDNKSNNSSAITSYCLLNKEKEREYSIEVSPSNNKMVIMFNDKEYLHRKCSFVTSSNHPTDVSLY